MKQSATVTVDDVDARPTMSAPQADAGADGCSCPEPAVAQGLPMLVLSLPDQVVRTANRAAGALLGLDQADLLDRHARDLVPNDEFGDSEQALAALADGALDSYHAHRNLVGATGLVEAWIQARSIPRTSGGMALLLLAAAPHDEAAGPPAVDLATGTVDRAGRVVTLTRSNPQVLGGRSEPRTEPWPLASEVHQDDQWSLWTALRHLRTDEHDVVLPLRVRHASHGWIATDCHLFSTGDDDLGQPVGFVMAEAATALPSSGRVAQLERHLDRIGVELDAARADQTPPEPDDTLRADLGALTPRQREIVTRLLRGVRVPSIAAALFVSKSTVRNHLSGVYRIFGVHSQGELIELLQPWPSQPAT